MTGGRGKLDKADMAMLPEHIRAAMQQEDTSLLVRPENWDAVLVFTRLSTQWRWHECQRMGLIYVEVMAMIERYAIKKPLDCFERIQVMEGEVLRCAKR